MPRGETFTPAQRRRIESLWFEAPGSTHAALAARAAAELGRPVSDSSVKQLKPRELIRATARPYVPATLLARGDRGRAEPNGGTVAAGRGLDTSSRSAARQDRGEIAAWIEEDRRCRRRLKIGAWRKGAAR